MTLEGLDAMCEREWPRLVGAMSLYTGDRLLAEEIAQESLARLCRDWARVQAMESPTGWLHRVAMNFARSHWRRLAIGRRATTRLASLATDSDDIDNGADRLAVRQAVAALPPRQRAVVVLRYFADFSVREVARIVGCPEGTVKTLTRSALLALRESDLVDLGPDHVTARRDT
jgi:RNA polymerase sigma-70 factor (sigma-E family)